MSSICMPNKVKCGVHLVMLVGNGRGNLRYYRVSVGLVLSGVRKNGVFLQNSLINQLIEHN